jgi:glycosyltransferase involved in cell wall biosynthesis
MKILTVADFCYPGVTGGASIVIYETMRRLVQRGHQITVLTRRGQGTPSEVEGMEICDYPVPKHEALYPVAVWRCRRRLQAILQAREFDIVNIHHPYSGFAMELVRGVGSALPSVFYFHGPWHKEAIANALVGRSAGAGASLKFGFRRLVDRFMLKRSSATVVLSDYMRGEAEEICPAVSRRIHKIPGGVDLDRFRPADQSKDAVRARLGLPTTGKMLLSVRRLAPRMGLEHLIRAMAIVESERDDVSLYIGGSGNLEGALRDLISAVGLRRTRLVGYIDDALLSTYYQASDLFIMPSLTLEGFGLATLEALACGVPVLGTPHGGTIEILEPVTPDFVLEGDAPADMARGILAQLDRVSQGKFAGDLRAYAERFSWDGVADTMEALFTDLQTDAVGRQ